MIQEWKSVIVFWQHCESWQAISLQEVEERIVITIHNSMNYECQCGN